MARRRMTLRRIDPWSVLKFGAVVNACLLVIALLGFGILWFAIRQLGVIDQACDLATDVGFESCAINGGNLFRYVLLLGLLWVVIQTGLMVFFAFLHNLIADLVGGVEVTLSEEGGAAMTSRSSRSERTEERDTLGSPPPRGDEQPTQPRGASSTGTAAAASGSAVAGATSDRSGGTSSGGSSSDAPSRGLPDRAPSAPPTAAAAPAGQQRSAQGGGWPWDPQQPRGERTSGTSQERTQESSQNRPRERSSQDPDRGERSGSQGGSQDQPEEGRRGRDEDDLFGRRDR